MNRRKFISGIVAASTLSVAGCSGNSEEQKSISNSVHINEGDGPLKSRRKDTKIVYYTIDKSSYSDIYGPSMAISKYHASVVDENNHGEFAIVDIYEDHEFVNRLKINHDDAKQYSNGSIDEQEFGKRVIIYETKVNVTSLE